MAAPLSESRAAVELLVNPVANRAAAASVSVTLSPKSAERNSENDWSTRLSAASAWACSISLSIATIGGVLDCDGGDDLGGGAAVAVPTWLSGPPLPLRAARRTTAVCSACDFTCSLPASPPPFGPEGCSPDVIWPICSGATGATRGAAVPAPEYA